MNDFKHWFVQKNETYKRNWLNLKVREDIDANTFRHEFESIKDEYNTLRGIYNTNNNLELNLPEPPIPRLTLWRGIGDAPNELIEPAPLVFQGLPPLGATDGIIFHGLPLVPLQGKKRKSKRKKNKRKSNK